MTKKSSSFNQTNVPMTKARLKAIVADYETELPEWKLAHDKLVLVRNCGPIEQIIWFQDLCKYYRPTHGISSLVLPEAHIRMLPQVLDVKHREVEHHWHDRKFADTLTAMEQQFHPDIRKPLDILKVLDLCEDEARLMPDTTNNMTMLAILYAWTGRNIESLDCCERMQHCLLPKIAPIPEWEENMRTFGRNLAKSVQNGSARDFLAGAQNMKMR